MKIIITGDLVVTDNYESKELIDENLKNYFSKVDYRIANLEAPITENNPNNKILKTGPHLRANGSSVLPTLKKLNIDLLTLANNHILDYGDKGLNDTLDFCSSNNIDWTGVGKNISLANKAKRIEIDNIKISIINFAENEWSSASEENAGANPMDIIDNTKLIKKEKKLSDFVFVIIHGGHEYYNLPSPRMQKQYRFYTDNGADLIVGHHTHCISGFEIYNNSPIYYSLGNFLFTIPSNYNDWYEGICLEILIDENKNLTTRPIFVKQNKSNFKISLVKGEHLEKLTKDFKNYTSIILNKNKLDENWYNYIQKKCISYLKIWSPYTFINNRYLKSLILRLGIRFNSVRARSIYLNNMRCEAHNDLSKAILQNKLKND